MIEPSKIKEEFPKVENENYKFRTYLKNHADTVSIHLQISRKDYFACLV